MCKICDSKACQLIGYGGVIWGVAFLVACVFVAFQVESGILMQSVIALAVVITVYHLAKKLNLSSRKEMLKYSIAWVVIVFILEYLIDTKFVPDILYHPSVWLGLFLIFVIPLLVVKK